MSRAMIGLNRCAYYYETKLLNDLVKMSLLSAITDKYVHGDICI